MAPRARLSMPPGAIIGYRKNGAPIRIIAGADGREGEGGEGGEGQDGGTGSAGAGGTGQQDGQDGGQAGTGGQAGGGTGSGSEGGSGAGQDDDKTARTIAAIRADFKDERGKRQAAERELADVKTAQAALQQALDADKADRAKQTDALAKALGLKPDDEPVSPEKLAAQLQEAQRLAEAEKQRASDAETRAADLLRQQQVERAVLQAAPGLDANGLALLDSRSFLAKVSGLDPAAGDFADKLTDAIKTTAESNPAYQVTKRQPPSHKSGGGEFNGTPGGQRQWTDADVDKASPAELQKAIKDGLLVDLGAGNSPKRRRR
ncbi:MAG: putative phage minor structural protein [Streptosporangiaceae bacterium]|nr:putative phage minor structural protein [Streptosporangiaceae bacterium]